MRHKRRGILEVNLTSLLDVLFCILFIVMLANVENENDIKNESQQQILQAQEQLEGQVAVYQNQIAAYQAQMASYDVYHTEAIIITIQNVQEGSSRSLKIYKGLEQTESDSISLGANKIGNVLQRLRNYFDEILTSLEDGTVPVYIIFHCNENLIYTEESNEIDRLLDELAETNKEIFYKYLTDNE